jgi:hypothetical protein
MEALRPAENVYRHMRPSTLLAWPLIAAAALASSATAHALELWLESMRLFGDGRANYVHSAQTFGVEAAAALFVIVLAFIARRLVRCALRARADADCFVPALDGIVRLGLMRTAFLLILTQFCALIGIELLEQRWSGFAGGLAAIFGPGHETAVTVHLLVGLCFAFTLLRVSRFVCEQTRAIVSVIATFLRRATQFDGAAKAAAPQLVNVWASGRKPPLLALGLANRPPPAPSAIAA